MAKDKSSMSQPQVRYVTHLTTNLSSTDPNIGLSESNISWVAGSSLSVRVPANLIAKDGHITVNNDISNNTIQYIVNYTDKPVQLHTQDTLHLGSIPAQYESGKAIGATVEIHVDRAVPLVLTGGDCMHPNALDTRGADPAKGWIKPNDYTGLTKIVGSCKVYLEPYNQTSSIDISHVQLEEGAVLVAGASGLDAVA